MNKEEFENLYNKLTEQPEQNKEKQQDTYLVQFDVQQTKFAFYKNQDGKYLCKFSFDFLEEPQRVQVQFKGKNDLQFKIDDAEDNEQVYELKKFKEYFKPQFLLFKEAFAKFKQFLDHNKKIKQQQNHLTVVPLTQAINQQTQQTRIDIEGINFIFNEIPNTFKDTFRADFELNQSDNINGQKYVTIIFKVISNYNYYVLEVYLNKQNAKLDKGTKISKDQFAQKFPSYFSKLNEAIKTYLKLND